MWASWQYTERSTYYKTPHGVIFCIVSLHVLMKYTLQFSWVLNGVLCPKARDQTTFCTDTGRQLKWFNLHSFVGKWKMKYPEPNGGRFGTWSATELLRESCLIVSDEHLAAYCRMLPLFIPRFWAWYWEISSFMWSTYSIGNDQVWRKYLKLPWDSNEVHREQLSDALSLSRPHLCHSWSWVNFPPSLTFMHRASYI